MSCFWCILSWNRLINDEKEDEVEKIIKSVEKKRKRKGIPKKNKYAVIHGELFEEISL